MMYIIDYQSKSIMTFLFLKNTNLLALIRTVLNSVPSENEITPLVRLCIRLNLAYLRHKEKLGYKIREHYPGTEQELEDIAVDAVAELFRRSPSGYYIRLQQYFIPRLNNCQTNEDCFLLLRKLVMSRTDQALFRIFRNRDPEGAKLVRNIKLAVDKDSDMEFKETVRGPVLIYSSLNAPPGSNQLPDYFDQEGLFAEIKNLFKPKDTIPVLLQKIRQILRKSSFTWDSITLRDAVYFIRIFRQSFKHENLNIIYPEAELILETSDLENKVKNILLKLSLKIDRDYVGENKLTAQTAAAFKKSLQLITRDMLDGGVDQSNFEYIRHLLPDISQDQYNAEFRTRFEYLIRLLKRDLKLLLFSDS